MTKNTKSLVTLVVIAGVLCASWLGLRRYNSWSEEKEQEAEEAAKIYLAQLTDVTSMEVTNENGTFSFTYNEDDETWSYDGDENLPLLQSKMTTLTGYLEDLEAVRKLDGGEDLATYGLDSPSASLTASTADSTVEILFGDKSEASSDYYVKLSDSDDVYTVSASVHSAISFTEDDLVDAVSFPYIATSNVTKVVYTSGDSTITWHAETREVEETTEEPASVDEAEEASEEESLAAADEAAAEAELAETEAQAVEDTLESLYGTEEETSEEIETEEYWMVEKDGTDTELEDTANFDSALSLIQDLSYDGFADYYMEDDEAADYGLDEASSPETLTIYYTSLDEDKSVTLTIGTTTEDGADYYCTEDDEPTFVSKLSADTVTELVQYLMSE
ncbi:MAG: DUF4340 domain-containing protein [Lachnospiraceae bacterium]|jgi:hypothetical protein